MEDKFGIMISDLNHVESKNQLKNACNESTYFTQNYTE